MKKQIFKQSKLSQNLNRFIKQEEGVYSILMAGMGVTLLAIIAFAVDGSGVILDQARLSDSLEQASLAVTSENNTYRKDKYQINDPTGKHDSFSQNLRNQRDKELVESYVNAYMPHIKSWTPNDISCKQSLQGSNSEAIKCHVSGTVVREALLPLTFSNSANSSSSDFSISTIAVAEKIKSAPPLDVMIVADFSGSMAYRIDDPNGNGRPHTEDSKSNVLKAVLDNLTANYLFKEPDTLNRIGFTAFSLGAKHPSITGNFNLQALGLNPDTKEAIIERNVKLNEMQNNCVLPYQFKTRQVSVYDQQHNLIKYLTESVPSGDWWRTNIAFAPNVDIDKTIEQIKQFDGSLRHYSVIFPIQRIDENRYNYATCVGLNKNQRKYTPGASYWFDKSQQADFSTFVRNIEPEGATLVTSGLFVGVNLMMDKAKHRSVSEANGNTQRTIVILSDGKDQSLGDNIYKNRTNDQQKKEEKLFRDLTGKFIDKGVCDVIRTRIDSLQDAQHIQYPTKLAFIAFGYEPDHTNETSWKKCVGDSNYFVAKSEQQLLESFKKAFTTEEVGHSLNR
ncbi:hypothetical protein A1D29_10710 [Pasteurellaceae bacterium Orientalotternb1]|nr:hypothetical protein A1D29_10710 [Pasteurellaceae bacterium Orientalotternb1]